MNTPILPLVEMRSLQAVPHTWQEPLFTAAETQEQYGFVGHELMGMAIAPATGRVALRQGLLVFRAPVDGDAIPQLTHSARRYDDEPILSEPGTLTVVNAKALIELADLNRDSRASRGLYHDIVREIRTHTVAPGEVEIFGRGTNAHYLPGLGDPKNSRRHFTLESQRMGVKIEDISTNGTIVSIN